MTLLPCSTCCRECEACPDKPTKLVVTIAYPSGDGVTLESPDVPPCDPPPPGLPPSPPFPGVCDYPLFNPLETDCEPPVQYRRINHAIIDSPGFGYNDCPVPSVEAEGDQVAPILYAEITSPVAGVIVTSGGQGYSSAPVVNFSNANSVTPGVSPAEAYALVRGPLQSVTVTNRGLNYTSLPTISFSDESGIGAAAIAIMTQHVKEFKIVNGGSGFQSPPDVEVEGPATAGDVVIRQRILEITVTSGGSGYTSAPSVTVVGQKFPGSQDASASAIVQGGQVIGIAINNPGEFQATSISQYTVTLEGGGGSGATAEVTDATNFIYSVPVSLPGTDYDSPPGVTVKNGETGGSGAVIQAVMGFHVQQVKIQQAGANYSPEVEVSISGGGGSGATATAQINGSVVEVIVTNASSYIDSASSSGSGATLFPSITFSGGGGTGAAATPVFAGELTRLSVVSGDSGGGRGYTDVEQVAFTGGGGQGAAARAFPTWMEENVLEYPVVGDNEGVSLSGDALSAGCRIADTISICTGTQPTESPIPPDNEYGFDTRPPEPAFFACGYNNDDDRERQYGENLTVTFEADFGASAQGLAELLETPPDENTPNWTTDYSFFFYGEAAWIRYAVYWKDQRGPDQKPAYDYEEAFLIKRNLARTTPQGLFEYATLAGSGSQLAQSYPIATFGFTASQGSETALLSPVLQQLQDPKGDNIWKITGFQVVRPGYNLKIVDPLPFDGKTTVNITPTSPNNFWWPTFDGLFAGFQVEVQLLYVPPVANDFDYSSTPPTFDTPPQFSFEFSEKQTAGEYELSSVTIENAGEIEEQGGTYFASISSYAIGYFDPVFFSDLPRFSFTVSGGVVSGAEVTQPGRVIGGASILAAELPDPDDSITLIGKVDNPSPQACIGDPSEWEQVTVVRDGEFNDPEPSVGDSVEVTYSYFAGQTIFFDATRTRRCDSPTVEFSIE